LPEKIRHFNPDGIESMLTAISPPEHQLLGRSNRDRLIGITTTVPSECIFAAGLVPVDLNNIFITSPDAKEMIIRAENAGFPKNTCCWIKGIWSAAKQAGISRVIGVVQGDCSNTRALMEMFSYGGVECIPFSFPYGRERELMEVELKLLCKRLGTSIEAARDWQNRLAPARRLLREIDLRTFRNSAVTGIENHLWQVCSSDFAGDPETYESAARAFLDAVSKREAPPPFVRLAYIGVPPICSGLYDFLEEHGARIIFNEMQRQFAMPGAEERTLVEQYLDYTYPYDIFLRLEDIRREIKSRDIAGVIHYTQSFCYHQIEDCIVRDELPVPVLTLDADRPGAIDGATKTRLEAFVEMLA